MEGFPGLPGAPQDEAGLTRKFETSHDEQVEDNRLWDAHLVKQEPRPVLVIHQLHISKAQEIRQLQEQRVNNTKSNHGRLGVQEIGL